MRICDNVWPHPAGMGGTRRRVKFGNGYGASVIQTEFSYGGDEGFFELAVMHHDQLCYKSPVTSDVEGWLTPEKVEDLLKQIEALPPDPDCVHSMRWVDEED